MPVCRCNNSSFNINLCLHFTPSKLLSSPEQFYTRQKETFSTVVFSCNSKKKKGQALFYNYQDITNFWKAKKKNLRTISVNKHCLLRSNTMRSFSRIDLMKYSSSTDRLFNSVMKCRYFLQLQKKLFFSQKEML